MLTPQWNLLQRFQEFSRRMQGHDPKQMLDELINSGKVTQDQVEQAKRMAEQFKGILK